MRFAIALCLTLIATPTFAKDLTITLNDDEQKALLALMDAGVKASGLNGVAAASRIIAKMQAANAPASPMTPASPAAPK